MGSGILLREITLASLPLTTVNNLTIVPILPEDSPLAAEAIKGIVTCV